MKKISKIDFKYLDKNLEKKTKNFIIQEYIKHYKNQLSPTKYKTLYKNMETLIKDKKNNAFFVAINEKEEIIGTISISLYDNRIKILKNRYKNRKIAELGRCYVLKEYRRQLIATTLLNLANTFAKKNNYEKLYLHTHYFLAGGFDFWSSTGFKIIYDEKDSLQTVHMEKTLN